MTRAERELQRAAELLSADRDALLAALVNYQCLVDYLRHNINPEEWASTGDWERLSTQARAAIAAAKQG